MNLELEDDDIICIDNYSGDFVEVYSKNSLNIQKVNDSMNLIPPKKGILVKNGSRDIFELPKYHRTMPKWYSSPPAHWPLIYTVRGKKVGIYGKFNPKIYKILP